MPIIRRLYAKPLTALLLLCLPLTMTAQRKQKKPVGPSRTETGGVDYKNAGAPLPPIRGVYPGKAVYTNKDLQNGANLFVMIFNPTCEHCEEMAMAFGKNIDQFRQSNILFLAAPHMGPYLEYFQNNTHVAQYPAIKIGLDSADFIQKAFRYENLPQVNIYSPEGKLIKSFSGITTIDSLRQYIQ